MKKFIIFFCIFVSISFLYGYMGDGLGPHRARKPLDLKGFDLLNGGTLYGNPVGDGSGLTEIIIEITCKAGENISVGDVVYVSGAVGQFPEVMKADAFNSSKDKAFGIASETKISGQNIHIVRKGDVSGFNTSDLTEGTLAYLGATGDLYDDYPSSGVVVAIGYCTYSNIAQGKISVDIDPILNYASGGIGQDYDIRMGKNGGRVAIEDGDDNVVFAIMPASAAAQVDPFIMEVTDIKVSSLTPRTGTAVTVNGNLQFDQTFRTISAPSGGTITFGGSSATDISISNNLTPAPDGTNSLGNLGYGWYQLYMKGTLYPRIIVENAGFCIDLDEDGDDDFVITDSSANFNMKIKTPQITSGDPGSVGDTWTKFGSSDSWATAGVGGNKNRDWSVGAEGISYPAWNYASDETISYAVGVASITRKASKFVNGAKKSITWIKWNDAQWNGSAMTGKLYFTSTGTAEGVVIWELLISSSNNISGTREAFTTYTSTCGFNGTAYELSWATFTITNPLVAGVEIYYHLSGDRGAGGDTSNQDALFRNFSGDYDVN